MKSDNGLFLSFDGVPRSGRTYQADRLAESLRLDGHAVVRVSMPEDTTPLAKTSLPWLSGRLAAYLTMVETQVRPALEAGSIVILDGGITSALIRTRAVMGANAPTGYLYLLDCIAMRAAAVDVEWIIATARDGERVTPGFERASEWKGAASSNPKGSRFAVLDECGARRHATYYLSARAASHVGLRYHGAVADLIAERMGAEWSGAAEETQDARDRSKALNHMTRWTDGDPMPLYGAIASWPDYTDETRTAIVDAVPSRKGAVQEFLGALQASGATLPSGDTGNALNAKMEMVASVALAMD
jgi:hypothetical protein